MKIVKEAHDILLSEDERQSADDMAVKLVEELKKADFTYILAIETLRMCEVYIKASLIK